MSDQLGEQMLRQHRLVGRVCRRERERASSGTEGKRGSYSFKAASETTEDAWKCLLPCHHVIIVLLT